MWEYDARGRRVGEINTLCTSVRQVIALGKVDGKEAAMIDDGRTLALWAKDSKGGWGLKNEIGVSTDQR
jgi:hypothetical protein